VREGRTKEAEVSTHHLDASSVLPEVLLCLVSSVSVLPLTSLFDASNAVTITGEGLLKVQLYGGTLLCICYFPDPNGAVSTYISPCDCDMVGQPVRAPSIPNGRLEALARVDS
jgi:hypothetical protein